MEEAAMKFPIILYLSALIFLATVDLQAGIYMWVDKDGVKRYSNTTPDETAEKVKVRREVLSKPVVEKTTDMEDGELKQAIQELEPETKATEPETKPEHQQVKAEQKPAAPTELDKRVQAETERLRGEIDRIEQLAVGPSLSIARKQAMIKEYKDKLNALKRSPGEYFGTE